MTRRRSSPLGLELVLSVVLALVVLPLLSHGAPVQETHAELQKYSEGCYYNYNHYSEGDRILTNEPCLNCTCHNRMLMCYLRVCPFTKPIGHDCTVEKREDQCCPIVTCPEVPVDIAHHSNQLMTTSAPGTELSIPEKYGCSIDNKFYVEGAQVPSNPNKPCELCYCIRNRTACLMQECTLHIDGCQPIYNKGSCCPVRYNCDHENELLEIEDFSTTTTTIRPTEGYLLPSTTSPTVTTDCVHNNEVYADGASITGKNSCEHCYCMRGDIVCAVQECEVPTLESGSKTCRAVPPTAGECCPSNYVCDDDSSTTEGELIENVPTTISPIVQSNLHESVSQEDVQLQEHIDDKIVVTELPIDPEEQTVESGLKDEIIPITKSPIASEPTETNEDHKEDDEAPGVEKEQGPVLTTVSDTSDETTRSSIETSTAHKAEEDELELGHEDKEVPATKSPIKEDMEEEAETDRTTIPQVVGVKEDMEEEAITDRTTIPQVVGVKEDMEEETITDKTTIPQVVGDIHSTEDTDRDSSVVEKTTVVPIIETEHEGISSTTTAVHDESEEVTTLTPNKSVPSKAHIEPEEIFLDETPENSSISPPKEEVGKTELEQFSTMTPIEDQTVSDKKPVPQFTMTPNEDQTVSDKKPVPESAITTSDSSTSGPLEETSSESVEFSEETTGPQGEIQDKIDESTSGPSDDSYSTSPAYEIISETYSAHTSIPEIEDHRTESALPKKKPKDEPESVEPLFTPSNIEKKTPQTTYDVTTLRADIEESEDTLTEKTSIESDEIPSEHVTDETPTIKEEEKPTKEDDEIPAIVEEITEIPKTPISGDISDEKEAFEQATTSRVDAIIEEGTTTRSAGTDKQTTTSRPTRIDVSDEKEESVETATKEIVTDGNEESSTSLPSIIDSAMTTEKEGLTDSVPITSDSEKPKDDEEQNKDAQHTTVKVPVENEEPKLDQELPETVVVPQSDLEDSTSSLPGDDNSSTEHGIELTTVSEFERGTSEGEDKKKDPEQIVIDLTTVSSSAVGDEDTTQYTHRLDSTELPPAEEEDVSMKQETLDSITKSPDSSSATELDDSASTTVKPIYAEREPSTDVEKIPEQEVSFELDRRTEETTTKPSFEDPATLEPLDTKHPQEDISESASYEPSDVVTEGSSKKEESDEKETPIPERKTDAPEHSTNITPSVSDSDEAVKEKPDSTTQITLEDEEIKKETIQKEGGIDSQTPISTADDDNDNKLDEQRTTASPLTETGGTVPDGSVEDSSTQAPQLLDSEIPHPATDAPPAIHSGDSTTNIPVDQDQKIDDINKTTVSPIEHPEEESFDSSEGSGLHFFDIIPSAIPGEGDCLSNGKTFSNNATVPTSSECELSCTCVNSIIVCQRVQCYEPPKLNKCVLDEASSDKCCPQYICDSDSIEEDQRPTTPGEIEGEEIQYTTLAPTSKHPEIPTESGDVPEIAEKDEIQAQSGDTQLSKTEKPLLSDINTTSPSINFEEPTVSSEQPMTHDKVDEDSLVESSTTAQPITSRPTIQVTGDIEPSAEVTLIPEYNVPSKKPEEIVPMISDVEKEESTSTASTHEVYSTSSDKAVESEETTTHAQETITKQYVELIADTQKNTENDLTTVKPLVASTEDSAPNVEISETSNESTEVPDSVEITKSPIVDSEKDQKTTTSKSIVSEHAGDIESVDESTHIPEIEMAKPDMPEDLSQTKIEDNVLLQKEKTTTSEESEEHEESEETVSAVTTTPSSTILTRVEPVEGDISDKIDIVEPTIKNESDDGVASQEGQTISSSTIKPAESDLETSTEPKQDKIDTQTSSSVPISDDGVAPQEGQPISSSTIKPAESDLEASTEPKQDKIDTQTSSSVPISDDGVAPQEGQPISSSTIKPAESDLEASTEPKQDKIDTQTISSVPISGDVSVSEEEKTEDKTESPTAGKDKPSEDEDVKDQIDENSSATDSDGDSKDKKHDVDTSTFIPVHDQTIAPVSSEENVDTHTSTLQPDYLNPQDEHTIKIDEIPLSQTSAPAIEKSSVGQTTISDLDDDNKTDITEPTFIEGSGSQVFGNESSLPHDETTTPAIDTNTAIAEASTEGIVPHSPEDSQTSSPTLEKETPSSEEEKISVTSLPEEDEHQTEGSGASPTKVKTDLDEIVRQTTSESTEIQTSTSKLLEDDQLVVTLAPVDKEGSGVPLSEEDQDDLILAHTTPKIFEEQQKVDVSSSPLDKEHSIEGSGLAIPDEDLENNEKDDSQTMSSISEKDLTSVTQASISDSDVQPSTSRIVPISETETEEIVPTTQRLTPSSDDSSLEEEAESDKEKTSTEHQTAIPMADVDEEQTTKGIHDSSSSQEEEDISYTTIAPVVTDKHDSEHIEHKKPSEEEPFMPASTEKDDEKLVSTVAPTKDEIIGTSETPSKISSDDNLEDMPASTEKDDEKLVSSVAPTKDEIIGTSEKPSKISSDDNLEDMPASTEKDDEKLVSTVAPTKDEIIDTSETPSKISSDDNLEDNIRESTEKYATDEEGNVSTIGYVTTSTALPVISEEKTEVQHASDDVSQSTVKSTISPEIDMDKEDISVESPKTTSSSILDEEAVSQTTRIPIEDKTPNLQVDEQDEDMKQGLPLSESDIEGELSQSTESTANTESEDSFTEHKDDATEIPETVSSHEIIPVKPESDDQILVEEATSKSPALTGSPDDRDEAKTTTSIPTVVDNVHIQPEKPESMEKESSEETERQTPKPSISTHDSSEEDVSVEESHPGDISAIAHTDSPTPESTEKEVPSIKPIEVTTGKPLITENAGLTDSEEEEKEVASTASPHREVTPSESEKQDDDKIFSTVMSADELPSTASPIDVTVIPEHTISTEKSDMVHTEATEGENKIDIIDDRVTDRDEKLTTTSPIEDTEIKIQPSIATEQPEKTETEHSLPKDENGKPFVLPVTESGISEEQTKLPEATSQAYDEDTKEEVQTTSTIEKSEEKTQAPEISSESSEQEGKPQIPESESNEDLQSPEVQTVIPEKDSTQHVQQTEDAIEISTTTEKQVEQATDDKPSPDIPRPILTDEQPDSEKETPLSTTTHPLFPHIEFDHTSVPSTRPNLTDKIDDAKFPESSPVADNEQPTTSKPVTSPPTSHYQPPGGYGQVPPQYPSYAEDEYTDEDETEVFGPGTCRYGGKLFVSAQQIPRDDPCDFCFCFRSDIICLQQSCPPPISGCHEEPISGFCCPRYECPVSMATTLNITTSTTTTSTTLPPHFLHHAYRGAAAKNGCHISGKSYKVGDKIDSASGPCMHCTCGGDGQMKCDPKTCSPEPMLRQMIAVVASRRR